MDMDQVLSDTALDAPIRDFLAHKRTLGRGYENEEHVLRGVRDFLALAGAGDLDQRAIVKSGVRRVGHAAALLSSMSSIPSLNLTPSMSFASWRNPRSRRQDFSAHRPIL